MPTGRMAAGGCPVPGTDSDDAEGSARTGRAAGPNDSPGADGSAGEPLSDAELERLLAGSPRVGIHPWGDHALALMLREGARVMDVRAAMGFLPADAVFEGVYGDVRFAVVFDVPHGIES